MAEQTTGIAQDQRAAWNNREELAERMVPLIGTLYRDNNVITSIYGRQLVHKGVIDIIKAHRYARQIDESVLPVEDTFPIVEAMAGMNLGAASVDLARLANKFKETGGDLQSFLDTELAVFRGYASLSTDVGSTAVRAGGDGPATGPPAPREAVEFGAVDAGQLQYAAKLLNVSRLPMPTPMERLLSQNGQGSPNDRPSPEGMEQPVHIDKRREAMRKRYARLKLEAAP